MGEDWLDGPQIQAFRAIRNRSFGRFGSARGLLGAHPMRTSFLRLSVLSAVGLIAACSSAPTDVEDGTTTSASPLTTTSDLILLEPPPAPETAHIDTVAIQLGLLLALGETRVQLSTWDNDPAQQRISYNTSICRPDPTYSICRGDCGDKVGYDAYRACLDACESLACTSHTCVTNTTSSFIRFPTDLKESTRPSATQATNCNANTCPACTTPSRVPTLHDAHIAVPPYHAPLGDCRLKQLSFDVPLGFEDSFVATSDTSAIHIAMTGHATSPTVLCNNSPNIDLEPKIRLDLVPSTQNYKLVLHLGAAFTGSITATHVINSWIIAAVRGWIRDAIDDRLTAKLDAVASGLLSTSFDRSLRQQLGLAASARFVSAGTDADGMWVKFYR